MAEQMFGKYAGQVIDNNDPEQLGRVKVAVPSIEAWQFNWALPCVPYVGPGAGSCAVPPIDALIWVEFEQGDVNRPIWSGCFWSGADMPTVVMPG